MYLSISPENMLTIGFMLLGWILAIHLLAQIGLNVMPYLGLSSSN